MVSGLIITCRVGLSVSAQSSFGCFGRVEKSLTIPLFYFSRSVGKKLTVFSAMSRALKRSPFSAMMADS